MHPPRWYAPFVALLEKVFWTYAQGVVTILLIGNTMAATTGQAWAIAALPAALTVLANGLPVKIDGIPFLLDLVYRAGRTYAVSFVGFLLAMPVFHLNFTAVVGAAAAAGPAALAVVKAGIASQVGNKQTAALLPASLDHGP